MFDNFYFETKIENNFLLYAIYNFCILNKNFIEKKINVIIK